MEAAREEEREQLDGWMDTTCSMQISNSLSEQWRRNNDLKALKSVLVVGWACVKQKKKIYCFIDIQLYFILKWLITL